MTTIGHIAELYDGPHATPHKTETGPYFLSISSLERGRLDLTKSAHLSETDFKKWTKRVTPKSGDLLFSYETRLGEAALMPDGIRACLGRRMGLLRPIKDRVIPEYLLYAYISPAFQQTIISNTVRGATVDRIALAEMPDFGMRVPDIEEQKKVANLLRAIDAKIDCDNRINAELTAMAKALYEYWFIQFDFPDKFGKPYKSSGGNMVWSEELKRNIPDGWKVENLKNNPLTELLKPGIDPFEEEKYYLATADVNDNDINCDANKITFKGRESRANMQPIINSVWFAKMKNSKKVLYFGSYADEYINKFILSTGFAGLVCNEKIFLEYVWSVLSNDYFELVKDTIASASTQEALNNEEMAYIKLLIPTNDILIEYHNKTKAIYQKIFFNKVETQKLTELRDWLLPMLMNGQLKVA